MNMPGTCRFIVYELSIRRTTTSIFTLPHASHIQNDSRIGTKIHWKYEKAFIGDIVYFGNQVR